MILYETDLNEWYTLRDRLNNYRFGVAEQALNALYLLAAQPDTLCGEIIKEKTRSVFSRQCDSPSPVIEGSLTLNGGPSASSRLSYSRNLSQLLFIVGHVASIALLVALLMPVKQIIHIEFCEAEFKRRKLELEKSIP